VQLEIVCGGGYGFLLQADDAIDDVADRLERGDGVVGNLDIEGVFDLERDVDLVERVDLQLVEGLVAGYRFFRDELRLRDDGNAALLDRFFVYALSGYSICTNTHGRPTHREITIELPATSNRHSRPQC
jgi:hypothetical protein